MSRPTLVLALTTTLDPQAARRLGDYGRLDDAGVTRGLEQVYVQRWGEIKWPGYLQRIDAVAAIIDNGERPTLVASREQNESHCLTTLFERWPDAATTVVVWNRAEIDLLACRAVVNDLVLPATYEQHIPRALSASVAPASLGHLPPTEQAEAEVMQLVSGSEIPPETALDRVFARYRLWLRWQYSLGHLSRAERELREQRLSSLPSEPPS